MKHNKSNTTLLNEIVIIFPPIYLSEATNVISLLNDRVTRVNSRCKKIFHEFTDHLRGKQYT